MSADSSATAQRHSPDPRLAVRAGQLLRVPTVWTIPLIVASAVVAVMAVLYISSVVNPLAHLRGLPVAVVNQDAGATIGSQHLHVGEQVQAGLVANPAVSHWLSLDHSSLARSEQAMERGAGGRRRGCGTDRTADQPGRRSRSHQGRDEPACWRFRSYRSLHG